MTHEERILLMQQEIQSTSMMGNYVRLVILERKIQSDALQYEDVVGSGGTLPQDLLALHSLEKDCVYELRQHLEAVVMKDFFTI